MKKINNKIILTVTDKYSYYYWIFFITVWSRVFIYFCIIYIYCVLYLIHSCFSIYVLCVQWSSIIAFILLAYSDILLQL